MNRHSNTPILHPEFLSEMIPLVMLQVFHRPDLVVESIVAVVGARLAIAHLHNVDGVLLRLELHPA
jgi:hypothetical protein